MQRLPSQGVIVSTRPGFRRAIDLIQAGNDTQDCLRGNDQCVMTAAALSLAPTSDSHLSCILEGVCCDAFRLEEIRLE
jgi:hypothetical protein